MMPDDTGHETLAGIIVEPPRPAYGPGVHAGLDYPTYDTIAALSSHRLMAMRSSPRHAQVFRERMDTDALRLGSMAHLAVLEPEKFHERVVISPKFDRRFKDQKEAAKLFEVQNIGKEIVDRQMFDTISAIHESLADHPAASKLLKLCQNREHSLVWNDRAGTLCKARPDLYSLEHGICCDLKTIKHGGGNPEEFIRNSVTSGRFYHWQAAFYLRGFMHLEMPITTWIWIVVETEEPYAVSCVKASQDILEYGRQEITPHIEEYAECARTGNWPAYSDRIEEPATPQWILDRLYGGSPS